MTTWDKKRVRNAQSRGNRLWKRWTDDEENMVLADDKPIEDLAKETGRSIDAIYDRRYVLKHPQEQVVVPQKAKRKVRRGIGSY